VPATATRTRTATKKTTAAKKPTRASSRAPKGRSRKQGDGYAREMIGLALIALGGFLAAIVFFNVGGGVAGVCCAEQLCRLRPDAHVVLVSASDVLKVCVFASGLSGSVRVCVRE
jgi:hypothetical protein